jgi:hypothetical protein
MISTARAESAFPGRLAISSDGNLHDRDDICATAITIAAIAATGNSDRLAYYAYCDHDWGTDLARENLMRQSTFETAQLWGGFNLSVFYNARQQPSTAVAALVAEINKSSADDPLTILAVGPMQVTGWALNQSDPARRQYVTVVSHSRWNDIHAETEGLLEG